MFHSPRQSPPPCAMQVLIYFRDIFQENYSVFTTGLTCVEKCLDVKYFETYQISKSSVP